MATRAAFGHRARAPHLTIGVLQSAPRAESTCAASPVIHSDRKVISGVATHRRRTSTADVHCWAPTCTYRWKPQLHPTLPSRMIVIRIGIS